MNQDTLTGFGNYKVKIKNYIDPRLMICKFHPEREVILLSYDNTMLCIECRDKLLKALQEEK